jgi:putative transcriptional regulator
MVSGVIKSFEYFDLRLAGDNIVGKFLVASPNTMLSDVFKNSVIYIVSRTSSRTTGIIVNNFIDMMPHKYLIKPDIPHIANGTQSEMSIPVYLGGPVDPERGLVLHSSDYQKSMYSVTEDISVSSSVDILEDFISGKGPKKALFAMGHVSWSHGKVEQEIEDNIWILVDANESMIFDADYSIKHDKILKALGVGKNNFIANSIYA